MHAVISLDEDTTGYVSVFAGRIADTGQDPVPFMINALRIMGEDNLQMIWASPREVLNLYQADFIGCHVITMTPELIAKLPLFGKDLYQVSLDTVSQFYDDGKASGLTL